MAIARYYGTYTFPNISSPGTFNITLSPAVDLTRAYLVPGGLSADNDTSSSYTFSYYMRITSATNVEITYARWGSLNGLTVRYSFSIVDDPPALGAGGRVI